MFSNFFDESKAYLGGARTPKNLPFEAMAGLFMDRNIYMFMLGMNEELLMPWPLQNTMVYL